MIADSSLPFTWVEKKSTKRFIEVLRPQALKHLPTRKRLSGSILKEAATECIEELYFLIFFQMKAFQSNYKCDFDFFVTHGFQIAKEHILGVVIKVNEMWLPHDDAIGIGNVIKDDEHDGIAVAKQIELGFRNSEKKFGIKFSCACTGDAGQCARAKRILSFRFPNMYFGKCYAHQVHLIVKGVFKIIYIEIIDRARKLINKYNASTSKWLVRLDKISFDLYGKSLALLRVNEVR